MFTAFCLAALAVLPELKDSVLPTTYGDPEKVEMLLGYLSRSEKDNDSSTTTPNNERTNAWKSQPIEYQRSLFAGGLNAAVTSR